MVAELGFEPRQTESESAVLPLHNSAVQKLLYKLLLHLSTLYATGLKQKQIAAVFSCKFCALNHLSNASTKLKYHKLLRHILFHVARGKHCAREYKKTNRQVPNNKAITTPSCLIPLCFTLMLGLLTI